jgi:HEAT repeat protein
MTRICATFVALALIVPCGAVRAETHEMSELLKSLDSSRTRLGAIRELEDLGLDAAPAVPRLIKLLDAPDKETRAAAADTLGAIGKDAADAIPKLAELLGEGELPRVMTEVGSAYSAVGIRAASALGQMGEEAVAPLQRALGHKSSSVRSNAACALQDIGHAAMAAVPSLIPLLKDRDELVRERAIWALGAINADAANTVPALVACLSDKNFNIRVAATGALGAVRPMTPAALKGLVRALHDDEGDVQNEAAEALGELGDNAIPAIPALIEMLQSRKAYRYSHPVVLRPVAGTAARTLGMLGPRAKTAMPALLDLIRDRKGVFEGYGVDDKCDNYEARGEAAIAAAKIDPQSDELLRILDQSLQEDDQIRGEVAVALALIGPKAKGTVPALLRFTYPNRPWPSTSREMACASAAVAIEPDNSRAVQEMLDFLNANTTPSGDDQWALLRAALGRAGAAASPAIPSLIDLVKDRSTDQRNAARTLAVFGPDARSAIPALLGLLDDSWEDYLRQDAIATLRQIASEESAPLLAALKSPNVLLHSGAVEVLGRFPGALPRITEALDDPSARVRLAALRSLAALGAQAKPAIPQIRKLLHADSRTLREAAAVAMQKIEKG